MPGRRMTIQTQLVLRILLENSSRELYGQEICALTGLPSGAVHQILPRLEAAAWLVSRWEDIDPVKYGRPRRHYYAFSPDGAERARVLFATARHPTVCPPETVA